MEKILIVDDIPENIYLLDVLLMNSGYTVLKAQNGIEALRIARQNIPDLVITDILMPEMDGFTLCREWKNDDQLKSIPLVFYTATYTDTKDEKFALSLGADMFLRKPMQSNFFLESIKKVIESIEAHPKPVKEPWIKDEEESYRLYSERLIQKLEKKMLDLEDEIIIRKGVELELKKARNEWMETFQAIGSPTLLLDADFNILHANRFALHQINHSEEQLIGKKCYDVLHQTNFPHSHCPLQELLNSKTSKYAETEVDSKDGTFMINCAPIKNENGEIEKIIHIAVDITDRKKMEVELKQSEEKFRQLVENIHEVYWIRDAVEKSILYISPMFEKIFKMPKDLMYTDPYAFMNVVLEDDKYLIRQAHKDQLEKGIETDITYRIEIDGQTRWIRSRAFPVRDDNGTVVWIAGVAEDISSIYQANIKQKQLEAQLMHTQKIEAIGTLAGGIAHDFNNILSTIIGFTEISLDDIEPGSTVHQSIREVFEAGLRAKDLVTQILTLAQKTDDEIKPVRVSKIAKEAMRFIRASIPASIEIIKEIDNDSVVLAPPAQIHQVIMNLLTNASHAMEKDGGAINISLSDIFLETSPVIGAVNFAPGNYVKMVISDTGIGIAEEHLSHIFDPYYTTKEIGKGTGLGLSITHGIIQKCGGLIGVESAIGGGTTFSVYLPTTNRRQPAAIRAEQPAIGSEHIFVVDDESKIVDLITMKLHRLGYNVTSSTSSVDALALFKAKYHEFDLVITDMTMPMMTGDELSAEIIKVKPNIPIILCTGYSKRISEESAHKIGVKAFLMKPLSMKALARQVRNVLDEKKVDGSQTS